MSDLSILNRVCIRQYNQEKPVMNQDDQTQKRTNWTAGGVKASEDNA
jgi:hypothetical protein